MNYYDCIKMKSITLMQISQPSIVFQRKSKKKKKIAKMLFHTKYYLQTGVVKYIAILTDFGNSV